LEIQALTAGGDEVPRISRPVGGQHLNFRNSAATSALASRAQPASPNRSSRPAAHELEIQVLTSPADEDMRAVVRPPTANI
jgi:hypothetical protein